MREKDGVVELTAKQFIRRLSAAGEFPKEPDWKERLDRIEKSIIEVPNTRNLISDLRTQYLEYRRSINIPTEVYDIDEEEYGKSEMEFPPSYNDIHIYAFYRGLGVAEKATKLARIVDNAGHYSAADSIRRLVPPFLRTEFVKTQLDELQGNLETQNTITFYELLKWMGDRFGSTETSIPADDFIELSQLFSHAISSENPDEDIVGYNLCFWLHISNERFKYIYLHNVENLKFTTHSKKIGNALIEFTATFIESLADPDDDKHMAARELFDSLINKSEDERTRFIAPLIMGSYNRDIFDSRLDQIAWLQSLKGNASDEEGQWYQNLYQFLHQEICNRDYFRVYLSEEIGEILSWDSSSSQPTSHETLLTNSIQKLTQVLPEEKLMRSTILLESLPNGKFGSYGFARIYGRFTNGSFVGSIGFIEDNQIREQINGEWFAELPKKRIKFSLDLSDPDNIEWHIIDPENLTEETKTILVSLLIYGIEDFLNRHLEAGRKTVFDQQELLLQKPDTSEQRLSLSQISIKKKGPPQMEPKKTKRRTNQESKTHFELRDDEDDGTFIQTVRERKLTPTFILTDEDRAKLLEGYDSSTKLMILRKLENQKRGTSRVKEYSNETGPNGRSVLTIRVNRSIRIYAERSETGDNTAIVYEVARKT